MKTIRIRAEDKAMPVVTDAASHMNAQAAKAYGLDKEYRIQCHCGYMDKARTLGEAKGRAKTHNHLHGDTYAIVTGA